MSHPAHTARLTTPGHHGAPPMAPPSFDSITVVKLPGVVPPEGWVVHGLHYGDTKPVRQSQVCRTPDELAAIVKGWAMARELK